ncbi:MAG TPA: NACHT domain-containing protein, partial [Ktedonobacteraceae bacterium]|nr:NACHT domain-containing protein [Ktedonobacteraceae bacterium]
MSEGNRENRLKKTSAQNFGDELGRLRYRARQGQGMTQGEVSTLAKTSVVSIRNWESGRYRPSMQNLQTLLEIYLTEGAFTAGKEEAEIRVTWEKAEIAGLRAALDEEWLARLLAHEQVPSEVDPAGEQLQVPQEKASLSLEMAMGSGSAGVQASRETYNELVSNVQASDMFVRLDSASALLLDPGREHMLRRVYNSWIKGVLKESLYNMAPLSLKLREETALVALSAGRESSKLHTLTDIQQVYDDADGKLLILGASGSGKSTLLLDLTSKLLLRAQSDIAHPIPAVFNLSSWSRERRSLAEWLVEELFERYQIPRKIGRQWIKDDRLLLLLDGLDEGPAELLSERVMAINLYSREHSRVPIVVCTRRSDYLGQSERLQLHNAVVVQPLSSEQIDEYLH